MKIEVPVRSSSEARALLKAGADILYGALPPEFFSSNLVSISRRPGRECNILSLRELKEICLLIKEQNKQFYFALNEHFYNKDQLACIVDFFKINKHLKNAIVADLGLILLLRHELPKLNIIASVGTHIFNSASLSFYLESGISEVVLPREISAPELKVLKEHAPQVKFSYIIKNDDCPNIDGLCNYSHGIYDISGPCTDLYNIVCRDKNTEEKVAINDYNFRSRQNCKVCQLKDFAAAGLDIAKIAGRGSSLKMLIKDTIFIKSCFKLIKVNQKDYVEQVKKKYLEIYQQDCFFCEAKNRVKY